MRNTLQILLHVCWPLCQEESVSNEVSFWSMTSDFSDLEFAHFIALDLTVEIWNVFKSSFHCTRPSFH